MALFGQKRWIKPLLDCFLSNQKGQVIGLELQGLGEAPTYIPTMAVDAFYNFVNFRDVNGTTIQVSRNDLAQAFALLHTFTT